MSSSRESQSDDAELLLRTSRRALVILLAIVLLVAADAGWRMRSGPGTLLAGLAVESPMLFPITVVGSSCFSAAASGRHAPMTRRSDAARRRFRQANLGRAQRLATHRCLVAQVPFGLLLSSLTGCRGKSW